MAGGLLLSPSYTEDIKFPAYQDRLLIKSLGIQPGIVGIEDLKVTAGAGLQVNVSSGKAFIEQTKAIEESNNTFYNGLYNVLNSASQNPYNVVEIFSSNPQIAQIILRVYDVNELKIGGSSYARIEWLNGVANAGATKAHVEAGEASSYGASVLPQSSYRIAYIIVPKNATTSAEYTIMDERNSCNEKSWVKLTTAEKVEASSAESAPHIRIENNIVARVSGLLKVKSGKTLESGNNIFTSIPEEYRINGKNFLTPEPCYVLIGTKYSEPGSIEPLTTFMNYRGASVTEGTLIYCNFTYPIR